MRLALLVTLMSVAGCGGIAPGAGEPSFTGRLLALSDTDMPGSAYADGNLEPLPGTSDTLTLLTPDSGALASAKASNSVLSWPQVLATSEDGRFAYVVETRAAPRAGSERLRSVQELPAGAWLTTLRVAKHGVSVAAPVVDVGLNPQSVSRSPDGRWLAVVNESDGGTVVFVKLRDGLPERQVVVPLQLSFEDGDPERFPRSLAWSPAGDWLAVNVALRRIAFYRVRRDAEGAPVAVTPHGRPVQVGKRLSRGIWTADGRFYLVSDINSEEGALARVIGAPGLVSSLAFDAGPTASHRLVSQAEVGGSPEGLALSPDEQRVATVNLERTFLPDRWFLAPIPMRGRYTVDLLDFDAATGRLTSRDRIAAEGVLPEDAVFDASGSSLAVAVFHRRRGPDRRRGFVDFFTITDNRLAAKGRPVALPRGVHDIEVLP